MSDAAGDVASKVAAGAASGAFAAFLLNPTELIKTRFMARGPELRNSAWACAAGIARERGVAGLWRGAGMSTARSAILTAAQCAAYDGAKSFVRGTRRSLGPENSEKSDDLFTHLCASMLTGLVTTTVTNPVDMIKTQLYVSSPGPNSTKLSASRVRAPGGAAEAARDVLRREGPRGFMRGWTANYLRLGPQTVITFVALEQLRKLAGMDAL